MLARRQQSLLHDLLVPSPGRGSRTFELVLKVAIVVVISMTFQIPDPALSAYIVFFVSKEDSGRSILISVVFIVAIVVTLAIVFLLVPTTLNNPSLRILVIAATSFVMFFLGKASKLEPLAATLGLILASGLNAEQNAPVGEIVTRGLLYVALFALFPIGVNIVVNIVCGRQPEQLLREGLAGRLALTADAVRDQSDDNGLRLRTLISQGNAELAAELKMITLFHRLPADTVARMMALINLTYALLLAVGGRSPVLPKEGDNAIADRLDRLAEVIRALPDKIDRLASSEEPERELAERRMLPQLETLTSNMEDVVAGASLLETRPKLAAAPKNGFLKPDAFSNPEYERFAAKATAAVMICYLTFNILDWPGISTCMVTCFIVALSTVGESTQKMGLRLTGCTFGAALGYATILFVLPQTTQITGLILLVGVITLPAAWIAFGSPRVSYIGFQIAFAAYLCVLQGTEPKFDLTIARDRFIGILFGNLTVFFIFTQVYAASLLPSLTRDLVTILDRCRDVLKAIAEVKPLPAIGAGIAEAQTLVQKIDGEIVAYGFEKRPTRYGRLHLLSCRQIDKALHNVISDIAALAADPAPREDPHVWGAWQARCGVAEQRLDVLARAIVGHTPLIIEGDRGDPAEASDFYRLNRHIDTLTIAAARYRRILRKEAEGAYS